MFLLKILLAFLSWGKCLSINVRKVFTTCVLTLMLKKVGGWGVGGGELGYVPLFSFHYFFFSRRHIKLQIVLYPFFLGLLRIEGMLH